MKATVLGLLMSCTFFVVAAGDVSELPTSPAAVAAQRRHDTAVTLAKRQYQQALLSADKDRVDGLEAARRAAVHAGDAREIKRIESAKAAAQAELEKQRDTDDPTAALIGRWRIRYASGAIRNYVILRNGKVRFIDESLTGTVVNGILDFDDGRVERITTAGDRLLIEHFDPKASFPEGPPLLGVGVKEQ